MVALAATYVFALAILISMALPIAHQIRCGCLSLAHTALMATGAFGSSLLWRSTFYGSVTWVGLALAACLAAVVGALCGAIVGYLADRVPGDAFIVVTLLLVGTVQRIGEASPTLAPPAGIAIRRFVGLDPTIRAVLLAGIALLWAAAAWVISRRLARPGLAGIADTVRHDREVAEGLGIRPGRVLIATFTWAGIQCSVAGCLHVAFHGFVAASEFGLWHSIVVFVMALAAWRHGSTAVVAAAAVLYAIPQALELSGVQLRIGTGAASSLSLGQIWPATFAIILAMLAFRLRTNGES